MNQIILAFITGLTTGGLSCLAVQGSLLASSMANQIETDMKAHSRQTQTARPILLFLAAKLIAYTLLGFLLGWLGSMIQLSPIARAVLMVAIGLFMILQALRLLNIHPFFQRFTIETPYFVRKWIRTTGKSTDNWLTPVVLGFLTVFIPCGITQAMMAAAMAAGDPLFGAALLFAFILGTSPVFLLVAYFATKLGSKLENWFNKAVAVVLVLLAVMNIQSAFNLSGLAGREVSAKQTVTLPTMQPTPVLPLTSASENSAPAGVQQIGIQIQNHGYFPEQVHVQAGQPIHLTLTSEDVYSCALSFVIPDLDVQLSLQPTDSQTVDLPALKSGQVIPFSCSMGMYTGQIVVD
jgi:uncharacterized protein